MLVAGACAILMGLSGRELSSEMDLFQIMFCRNLIALSFTIIALLCTGLEGVRTRFIKRHVFRNLVHFSATYLWFLGIISIPMAAVFALEFTTPLWTAILAVLWLKERLNPPRIFGVLIGFLGILVILRPGIAVIHPAAFAVIASAIGLSVAYVITKSVVHEDSAWTILFWMNLIQLPLSLGLSLQNWVWPSEALIPWVLGIGIAGFGLHLMGHWARDLGAITLPEAIYELTAKPAKIFRIPKRGKIEVGYHADLLLFDPAKVARGIKQRVHDLPGGEARLTTNAIGVHGTWVNGFQVANQNGVIENGLNSGQLLRDFHS